MRLAGHLDARLLKRGPDGLTRAVASSLDRIAVGHPADPILLFLPSLDLHLHVALPRERLKEIKDEDPGPPGHGHNLRPAEDVVTGRPAESRDCRPRVGPVHFE